VVRFRLAERGEASRVLTVALFVWRVESLGSGLDGGEVFDGGDSIVRAPMFLVRFRYIYIPFHAWTTIMTLLVIKSAMAATPESMRVRHSETVRNCSLV
jgi:hypothetical protein